MLSGKLSRNVPIITVLDELIFLFLVSEFDL
jgi:hypothetical protein